MVKRGEPAPTFRLPASNGNHVALQDFLGKRNVVIYFYPKDFSLGCTREACKFMDLHAQFQELDAEVVGISPDSEVSHEKFARNEKLRFALLSDLDGSVRRAYGVKSTLGLIPGRTTFVVDKSGIIRHVYASQMHPERHAEEALKALRSLAG